MTLSVEAVAAAAATTLANAIVTDGWKKVRARVGRLLGRGSRDRELAALVELDELAAAHTHRAQRLYRLLVAHLAAHPAAAAEVAALCDHIGLDPVRQRAHATRGGLVIQAGRDVTINEPR